MSKGKIKYANNNESIARGFSLRLVKLGHR